MATELRGRVWQSRFYPDVWMWSIFDPKKRLTAPAYRWGEADTWSAAMDAAREAIRKEQERGA